MRKDELLFCPLAEVIKFLGLIFFPIYPVDLFKVPVFCTALVQGVEECVLCLLDLAVFEIEATEGDIVLGFVFKGLILKRLRQMVDGDRPAPFLCL